MGFAGPRTHWEHNGGCDWSLLVADETGLPAALSILEALPAGHRAVALLEVAGKDEHQEVDTSSDADLRWLRRGRAADAVRELGLPWGRGHVWGAGESRTMRAVRDELRRRRGVDDAAGARVLEPRPLERRPLQHVDLLERVARAQHHAGERVVGQRDRHVGLVLEALREAPQQRAAARQQDARAASGRPPAPAACSRARP